MARKKKVLIDLRVPSGSVMKVSKSDKIELGQVLWTESRVVEKELEVMLGLPIKTVKDWVADNLDRKIEDGELLYKTGFLGRDRVISDLSGKVVGVDEFGKVKLLVEKEKISFESPVTGQVKAISEGKIQLEIGAVVYKGQSNWDSWLWAREGLAEVGGGQEMDESMAGKMVLVGELDRGAIIKAGVLGIVALLSREEGKKDEVDDGELPVFWLKNADFNKLLSEADKVKQVGIDGNSDKLFLIE